METHNIDSIFRKAVENSADFYNKEADEARDRIWMQVRPNRKTGSGIFIIRLLAAACILLAFCTIFLSVSYKEAKKSIQHLTVANQSLQEDYDLYTQNSEFNQHSVQTSNVHTTDTMVIEKKVIIYRPMVEKEKIIDTVFVKQLVEVEKEKDQESALALKSTANADSGFQSKVPVPGKEILISNHENKEPQRKKFQVRFGGDKGQKNDVPLAFTVHL